MSATDKTKLDGIASWAQVNSITWVKGNSESTYRTGNVNITKSNIWLCNVDNTSDASKPISTATQNALDEKQPTLISGTNIKTVNSTSLLGNWNIAVQATLVSWTNIKTINWNSILGSWNLTVSWLPTW
jgi:hypothetical protein